MKPLNVAEDIGPKRVTDAIARGLADVDAGRTLTDAASQAELSQAFGPKRHGPRRSRRCSAPPSRKR